VNDLVRRVAGAFVEPEEESWAPRPAGRPAEPVRVALVASPAPAARVAVVCSGRDVGLAGAAVGLGLVERAGARCAVVLEWTGEGDRRPVARPAAPSARRCAATLADRALVAVASGRLVRVALAADEAAAVAAVRDVAEVLAEVPRVLAVGGPRGRDLEALLAEEEALVLATRPGADGTLVELASAELDRLGPAVAVAELPPAPVAAALARAGVTLVAPLRAPILDSGAI
jgi:hypothetical protein